MSLAFSVRAAFVCDDVRQEINGKKTFIGVYNPTLYVASFPAALKLHFGLITDFESEGEGPIKLRLVSDQPGTPAELAGRIVASKRISGEIFSVGPLLLEASRPSEFYLEYESKDGWQKIGSWKIELYPESKSADTPIV